MLILFLIVVVLTAMSLFAHPIYSVFAFILFVCLICFLIFFLHLETLGFIILMIYIGAIAVLFLFAVILHFSGKKSVWVVNKDLPLKLFFISFLSSAFSFLSEYFFMLYNNFSAFLIGLLLEMEFVEESTFFVFYLFADINVFISLFNDYPMYFFFIIIILFIGIIGTAIYMRKK